MEHAADSFTSAALLNEVMIELVTDLRRLALPLMKLSDTVAAVMLIVCRYSSL